MISNHMERFKNVKNEIKIFLQKADEEMQFHVKLYKLSISKKLRTKANGPDMLTELPFDIPSPYIKYRLLGNILELRAEIMQQTDMMQFVGRLSQLRGCEGKAVQFHQQISHKCKRLLSVANKCRVECDNGKYYSMIVEILLLQLNIIHLQFHSSIKTSSSTRQQMVQDEFKILSRCEAYIEKHTPCQRHQSAVNRTRESSRYP